MILYLGKEEYPYKNKLFFMVYTFAGRLHHCLGGACNEMAIGDSDCVDGTQGCGSGIARELAEVRQKIASLAQLTGGSAAGSAAPKKAGAKRQMSAAGRAAIAKAAKKRWAKHRADKRAAEAKQG